MFEKVNMSHPDKIADRIAGAIVDLGYKKQENPKVAVEVLIGHGECNIIIESSCEYEFEEVKKIVDRIAGDCTVNLMVVPQDVHLANNQSQEVRCGDNGIFKGTPQTREQTRLAIFTRKLYELYPFDGKFILDDRKLIVCQSNIDNKESLIDIGSLARDIGVKDIVVNPLGTWTGGIDVDSGATNRKLGSDMGDSVTGGGLHGKDLSKADVSVNIYAWLKAQERGETVEFCCAIGDTEIDGKPYKEIADIAKEYIWKIGGFEKFAELGLIR